MYNGHRLTPGTSEKVIGNLKENYDEPSELDGFDELPYVSHPTGLADLSEDFQDKISEAWKTGHIDPNDIPETAKRAEGDDDEEEEESPKKKPKKSAPAKKKKKADADSDDEDSPKKKAPKKAAPKKAPAKKSRVRAAEGWLTAEEGGDAVRVGVRGDDRRGERGGAIA